MLTFLRCLGCRGALTAVSAESPSGRADALTCDACGVRVPIVDGIPRFVPAENYASNFGFQWNRFRRTQLDSFSGTDISKKRLYESTGWDWSQLAGKRVLDAGCGAGRFAEIALESGAHVTIVDYSSAIDAAAQNLERFPHCTKIQASILDLPFAPGSFDFVYCLGVLQHTPDPEQAFHCLVKQVAPGGRIAVDMYPWLWKNALWSKYWFRPLTKHMSSRPLMRLVETAVPVLLPVSLVLGRTPVIGRWLRWLVPVANYDGVYRLSAAQVKEWAILDTFDMFSPAHDHPKSAAELRSWLAKDGLTDVEVFRKGHLIARGRVPESGRGD